jgi:cytoplasmic iron level regulating protein YaaA (DUF328/UPF0246 family)
MLKIVISPAKSLDFSRTFEKPYTTKACFLDEADYLIKKLQKMSAKKIGELMHLSTDLADLNYNRYQNWVRPEEESEVAIPALFAFTGEVYRGIDVETLNSTEIQAAQNQLRILSGLYGMLKPLDLMYPYRLEMGTKLNVTPKTTNLYQYWGTKIAQKLNEELATETNPVLVNLASNEYFKAVDLKTLKAKVITPVFKEFKNGKFSIVMMYAKHARGAMARYIIQQNIQDVEALKTYTVDGYSFDVNQSTENEWVFTR